MYIYLYTCAHIVHIISLPVLEHNIPHGVASSRLLCERFNSVTLSRFVRVSFVLEWTLIDLRRKWVLRSMTLKKNPALNFVDLPRLSEMAIRTLLPRAGMLSTGFWVCSNTWECRDLPFFYGSAQNAGQAEDESWEWERKGMGWERLTMTSLPLHWGWETSAPWGPSGTSSPVVSLEFAN